MCEAQIQWWTLTTPCEHQYKCKLKKASILEYFSDWEAHKNWQQWCDSVNKPWYGQMATESSPGMVWCQQNQALVWYEVVWMSSLWQETNNHKQARHQQTNKEQAGLRVCGTDQGKPWSVDCTVTNFIVCVNYDFRGELFISVNFECDHSCEIDDIRVCQICLECRIQVNLQLQSVFCLLEKSHLMKNKLWSVYLMY